MKLMRKSLLGPAAALLLVAGVGAACGGGSAQPSGSIKVTMTEFKFDHSDIEAKAGKVTFFLVNSGSAQHDMVIEDTGGKVVAKSDLISAGDSGVFTVNDLSAGSYTFICYVPGHKEAGMTGTLTVS